MSFTEATLVHTFKNADGTAASGSITFSLEKRMTNGGVTLVPSALTSNLNGTGELSQALTSNEDSGTIPTDSRWRVDLRILGDAAMQWYIKVPAGGGTVNLSTLLPAEPKGN